MYQNYKWGRKSKSNDAKTDLLEKPLLCLTQTIWQFGDAVSDLFGPLQTKLLIPALAGAQNTKIGKVSTYQLESFCSQDVGDCIHSFW